MIKYLFLFVALFLTNHLYAQKNIGLMAGSSFSNRTNKNVPDLIVPLLPTYTQVRPSFYIGGYADFSLSDLIYLSPALFYASRGWNYVSAMTNTTAHVIYNSIILPIFAKFNGSKKLQLYTGPEFSQVISRKLKDQTVVALQVNNDKERAFDIAIPAGGSFEVIKNLFIDFRYNLGLIDQAKTYFIPGEFIDPGLAGQQVRVDYKAYNRSFQVGLKYNFVSKN